MPTESDPAHDSRLVVLVAEDNPVIQSVLRTVLTWWGYQVVLAADGMAAWRMLQSDDAPRLAIVDWMMPGMDGPELCRRVRGLDRGKYTYLVMLTSRGDTTDVVEGLDAGADDYLTKPFNSHELRARLRAGGRILQLEEQLLATQEALRAQATRDALTGLLNHGCVLEALDREIAKGGPVAVALVQPDRLRQINEMFGRPAGDAVLREIARRVRQAAPPGAALGRYGGVQFLMVLPGGDQEEATAQAAWIRLAVSATPFRIGAAAFPLSCRVGTAWGKPVAAELLRDADEALAAIKVEPRTPA